VAIVIVPGQQLEKDPSDWKLIEFDWDTHLAVGAAMVDKGTLVITDTTQPPDESISLTQDEFSLVAGNRKVHFRLKDGTPGHMYNVSHFIETNETPSQKRDRSFFVWVRQK